MTAYVWTTVYWDKGPVCGEACIRFEACSELGPVNGGIDSCEFTRYENDKPVETITDPDRLEELIDVEAMVDYARETVGPLDIDSAIEDDAWSSRVDAYLEERGS